MFLEKFNDYPNLIELNMVSRRFSVVLEVGGEKKHGVGDLIGNELVFFHVKDGALLLEMGGNIFDLSSGVYQLKYSCTKESDAIFSVNANGGEILTISYEPWWKKTAVAMPAGFGAAGDDEEDLLAYITLMSQSETRVRHLINKYS